MTLVNQRSLVGKLNGHCRRALEGAAGLCLSRTNYNVEIEHWLLKLLEAGGTDLEAILRRFEIDASRLSRDLTRAIDRLPTGNARTPALSQHLFDLTQQSWLVASVEFQSSIIRSGHLILALIGDQRLANVREMSPELTRLSAEALQKELTTICSGTLEESLTAVQQGAPPSEGGAARPATGGPATGKPTPALDQYTINLTRRAREGKIDPVIGRDPEIRQVIDILMRRRQNNPILTGEAGVGKTAVVEGFALLIAADDVPPPLKNVELHTLDLGLLQAGAGVKGEFEARLKSVLEEVKSSPKPIIIFIDEAHNLIGAGGGGGQNDAANLLKPALARGEFRTIAATTWAEYKKYFEKDAALARRFQVVKVDEPTERTAVEMMRGLVATLEDHHGVMIENEAVEASVKLSNRYITGRQLPDKSVSVLDTTCAAIALSQAGEPPAIRDRKRRIEQINIALDILGREEELGLSHDEQKQKLSKELAEAESSLKELMARWEQERELAEKMKNLRKQLRPQEEQKPAAGADATATATPPPTAEQRDGLKKDYETTRSKLLSLQGEAPLVHAVVTQSAIAATIAAWTGIPLGRMVANEMKTVLRLKELMEESIVGQSHALEDIALTIRTSRAHLSDPSKPIGVFLLAGSSGVGKTETAITLANLLYGGEQNLTVINMSEFKEEHKVSLLMGSPPGYVGYGEGGVLTEAVRRKPYSVILLDEMEKAHPGVQDIFYQVFDKGSMKDGEGRDINFRNCVILMTTNAGTDVIKSLCNDPDTLPDPETFSKSVFPTLLTYFKPAFMGRLKVIPYYPLAPDVMRQIIVLKLGKIRRRIEEHYGAKLEWSDALVETVASRCTEVDTGARNIDNILTRTLLPELSTEFLGRMTDGAKIQQVRVDVGADGQFTYAFN